MTNKMHLNVYDIFYYNIINIVVHFVGYLYIMEN